MTAQQHPNEQVNPDDSVDNTLMETYQFGMSHSTQHAAEATMANRPYEDEAQAPTHDALSSIYNRGY